MEGSCWSACADCLGRGKKSRRLRKKTRLEYQSAFESYLQDDSIISKPVVPKASTCKCKTCDGTGLVKSMNSPVPNPDQFPHLAIIGLGIGGAALAVACLHRGIPFSVYERDPAFDTRSQGYGLTLQQASSAMRALGICSLQEGVASTRHVFHGPTGVVLGEWGVRKWLSKEGLGKFKRSNIHIARQSLRLSLLTQVDSVSTINWNHKLVDFSVDSSSKHTLSFLVDGKLKEVQADLIVGADGIRSVVRKKLFKIENKPLHYLGCLVILGICSLERLKHLNSDLLDSATVFQTANGHDRIYVMPYSQDKIMWQFSFPIQEVDAKALSDQGPKALKEEAMRRVTWHEPLPQILKETDVSLISGYPVYDRAVLVSELKEANQAITLLGDAAHPMSPFKGQGANQAIFDALSLARSIYCKYKVRDWRSGDLRIDVLNDYEAEMIERSAIKVKDSAVAADFLHSEAILEVGDHPRRSSQ